jgi:hypothetical protein
MIELKKYTSNHRVLNKDFVNKPFDELALHRKIEEIKKRERAPFEPKYNFEIKETKAESTPEKTGKD